VRFLSESVVSWENPLFGRAKHPVDEDCPESGFQVLRGVFSGMREPRFSARGKNHTFFSFLALTVFSFGGKKWVVVEESGSFLHYAKHAKPRLQTDQLRRDLREVDGREEPRHDPGFVA
jgi:hypothetical protein